RVADVAALIWSLVERFSPLIAGTVSAGPSDFARLPVISLAFQSPHRGDGECGPITDELMQDEPMMRFQSPHRGDGECGATTREQKFTSAQLLFQSPHRGDGECGATASATAGHERASSFSPLIAGTVSAGNLIGPHIINATQMFQSPHRGDGECGKPHPPCGLRACSELRVSVPSSRGR